MTDPYKVLGVSPQASDEEIKKAYRALVKKYHPDNYVDNPLADLADEKMKEINEAYDTITRMRASGGTYSSGGNDTYSSGYTGSSGATSGYARIRDLINQNRISEAEILLDREPDKNSAEHLTLACQLDPSNAEYRNMLDMFSNTARSSPYNTADTGGCTGCDICTGLICADLMCSCCR